jgi:hypothetical protein
MAMWWRGIQDAVAASGDLKQWNSETVVRSAVFHETSDRTGTHKPGLARSPISFGIVDGSESRS